MSTVDISDLGEDWAGATGARSIGIQTSVLKGGAHVVSTPEDDALVARLTANASRDDLELAIARAGCTLMDREKASPQVSPSSRKRATPSVAGAYAAALLS